MILVAAVDPAADYACGYWILKCVVEIIHDNLLVVIINHDKRCLAVILVPYSDFACHYVWQSVDERRWTWEKVFLILYSRLVMCVCLQ